MRSIRLWMWCRRFFEKGQRVRAVSIHVLPSEDHARWHFLEENATWSLRFCKEQNRNRCSRRARWSGATRDRVAYSPVPLLHARIAPSRSIIDALTQYISRFTFIVRPSSTDILRGG